MPCDKKGKRTAQTFKGTTEIKPKSQSLNNAHALLIAIIFLSFNILSSLDTVFFYLSISFFHWSISFIVFGIQRRGAAVIVLVKTCRSVRYVAYAMNSQTTLTSLACQKTWAFAIYYERKKDLVFKVCKYYSQLKHEFD